jgi:hypothetical protein
VTPYERLLVESIPTRPAPATATGPSNPWTPEEQAEHLRVLLAALDGWHWHDDTREQRPTRHLHAVPPAA